MQISNFKGSSWLCCNDPVNELLLGKVCYSTVIYEMITDFLHMLLKARDFYSQFQKLIKTSSFTLK